MLAERPSGIARNHSTVVPSQKTCITLMRKIWNWGMNGVRGERGGGGGIPQDNTESDGH